MAASRMRAATRHYHRRRTSGPPASGAVVERGLHAKAETAAGGPRRTVEDCMAAMLQALGMAFAMFWEFLWAFSLGFGLSAIVQAVVGKGRIVRLLPDDSPRTLAVACALGAASSSCSYAAVALARSLFRKGANFTAAMAFMLASTNLVA